MIRDFLNAEDDVMNAAEEAAFLFPMFGKDKCNLPKPDCSEPPVRPDVNQPCHCDLSVVDALPVGATYAPMQVFRNLYSPEAALCRGTLYKELDLPFLGGKNK